jgi:hypothetical protein
MSKDLDTKIFETKDLGATIGAGANRRGFRDDCRLELWKARLDVTNAAVEKWDREPAVFDESEELGGFPHSSQNRA